MSADSLVNSTVISPRQFGIIGIAFFVCLCVFLFLRLRSKRSVQQRPLSQADRDTLVAALPKIRYAIVFLLIALCLGLWLTRGGPLVPRLAGVVVTLSLTVWLLFLFFKAKWTIQ
jgi:Na+/H+ antiporter NhaC